MKSFIKTLPGKTCTFIFCIIFACVFAASIIGIVYLIDDGRVYRYSEEKLNDSVIVEEYLWSQGYTLLWDEINEYPRATDEYIYQISDENGNIIAESSGFQTYNSKKYTLYYEVLKDEAHNFINVIYSGVNERTIKNSGIYYTVSLAPVEGGRIATELSYIRLVIHVCFMLRYWIYLIAVISLLFAIICFVSLMYTAGRRKGTDDLVPGSLHKFPYDLLVVICVLLGVGLVAMAIEIGYENDTMGIVSVLIAGLFSLNMLLGLCMSFAGRVKQHLLWKNTFAYLVIKLIRKAFFGIWNLFRKVHEFNVAIIHGLPFVWKTSLVFAGISLVELVGIVWFSRRVEMIIIMWVIEKIILFPIILYLSLMLRKLQQSGIALANGDLSYQTDTKGMLWDFKQHGNNLNSIGAGMAIAVAEQIKSERMKTELITNVSHDIKTPLTSIINYATLINSEMTENSKITEYSEVLVRQSEKLKRLIEDLVEASKASTGNLDVILTPCDVAVFISQVSGEYEEKIQKAELSLITKQPEQEICIMADGRRMWRIFDNLMNNICKYAMPGTRVYLSLEEYNGNAVISFKNTSRDSLDVPPEELMERFTRGDSSRNTEGNGLGLSIAKSMAELQGGKLNISIDGDLFKAVLIFPVVK